MATARRYRRLGYSAIWQTRDEFFDLSTPRPPLPPFEGASIRSGLRTRALHSAVGVVLELLCMQTHIPKAERLQAAHDLAYAGTGLAGLHVLQLPTRAANLKHKTIKDATTGRYVIRYDDPASLRHLFPRLHNPSLVKLKCPAHVLPSQSPAIPQHTNLENLFHASLNEAAAYGLYDF